jgi:hypothetical protein
MNEIKAEKFFTEDEREKIVLTTISVILFISCFIVSFAILPENCYLYEWRQVGFLCDGIDIKNPQPCPMCNNGARVFVAQIIFCLSIVFFFLPVLVSLIKKTRLSFSQNNLFD